MAFTTLTEGMRNLLKYWGSIMGAAQQRAGTANLRQLMTDLEVWTELGVAEPTWSDYQAVYGLAVANRNASERLMAAGDDAFVDPSMIGLTPNARSLEARNAAPSTRIRVGFTTTVDGEQSTGWLTLDQPYGMTTTKGTLVDFLTTQLTSDTSTLVGSATFPGSGFVGIHTITLAAF